MTQQATPASSGTVFHPDSPMAELARLGVIAHVNVAPIAAPSSTPPGAHTLTGGQPPASTAPAEVEMHLGVFVANVAASLTLAAYRLGQAPAQVQSNFPGFQLRSFSMNLNVDTRVSPEGHVLLRSPQAAGTSPSAGANTTITVSFDPFPLIQPTTPPASGS